MTLTTTTTTPIPATTTSSNSKGRSRSPIVQPLRHRQLPASFWQEPNVPRGHLAYPHLPYPFPFRHWVAPPSCPSSSSSCSSSTPAASEGRGGGVPGKQRGVQEHKEFLDRLQSAQVRGYDLAASSFPITHFLFYNYGLRSYLNSSSSVSAQLPPPLHPPLSPHPHSCSSALRPEDTAAAANSRNSAGTVKTAPSRESGPHPRLVDSVCGFAGLTYPTVCPYLGYSCPHLHSGRPHRLWDCVLGQAAAASSSSSSSLSLLEESRVGQTGGGSMWKGSGGGRTASAYPGRYHPFARV
ncbi:hypothetical protein ACOMHN_015207 [Nucella lapillus]